MKMSPEYIRDLLITIQSCDSPRPRNQWGQT